jgi:hypothetical protein
MFLPLAVRDDVRTCLFYFYDAMIPEIGTKEKQGDAHRAQLLRRNQADASLGLKNMQPCGGLAFAQRNGEL